MNVSNLINFYFLQQFLPYNVNRSFTSREAPEIKKTILKEIVESAKKVKTGSAPVQFGIQSSNGGHSIIAYDCNCVAKMDEATKQHRIVVDEDDPNFFEYQVIIYDCSRTKSKNYTPTYMYIGRNYDYCWYEESITENGGDGYWIDWVDGVDSSIEELNLIDYTTGELSPVCRSSMHYNTSFLSLVTKDIEKVHIDSSSRTARLSRQGEGEGELYTTTFPDKNFLIDSEGNIIPSTSYTTFFDEDFNDEDISIALENSDECDLCMVYSNSLCAAEGSSVDQVDFKADGDVAVLGKDTVYTLSMTFNEGYYTLPWHTITASGKYANQVELQKTEDGIILTGDNLQEVTVTGESDDAAPTLQIKSVSGKVLITNHDDKMDVMEDRDGNGTFETKIATTDEMEQIVESLPGDVDEDGEITLRDALRLYRFVAGWNVTINEQCSDVDADGEITLRDALRLYRYCAGWNVKLL